MNLNHWLIFSGDSRSKFWVPCITNLTEMAVFVSSSLADFTFIGGMIVWQFTPFALSSKLGPPIPL